MILPSDQMPEFERPVVTNENVPTADPVRMPGVAVGIIETRVRHEQVGLQFDGVSVPFWATSAEARQLARYLDRMADKVDDLERARRG